MKNRDQWEAYCESNPHRVTFSLAHLEPHPCDAPMGKEKVKRLDTPCSIHVHSRRYRLADADGISAKAVLDGLVHAGILQDDSPEYVQSVTYSQEKIPKSQNEETVITITPVSPHDSTTTKKQAGTLLPTPSATKGLKSQIRATIDKPACTNCRHKRRQVCNQCPDGGK